MEHFTREHKIAFARVITDLIEADFVVEADEMQFFEKIISKRGLNISEAMLIEAKKINLAKALSILTSLDASSRKVAVDMLKQLSLSDGVCVPLEAILIFAVEQVLMNGAIIHSIPQSGINIDNFKAIYIESEETETGHQIESILSVVTNEFKLVGFDFVYIPRLSRDFGLLEHNYLKKIVKYMIPSISNDRIDIICENLRTLTTSRFCRDLLYKKLGLNLIECKPSLLIKISDSDVVNKYDCESVERTRYSNFLQLELHGNVMNDIRSIIEGYHSKISCSIVVEHKPQILKFVYTGFHRSLFDLIAFGRELKEYILVFEISNHRAKVYFESIDKEREQIILKLNPQETALYYMIVKKSLIGDGLDWREHIPDSEKKALLSEYNEIYRIIGKANTVTEYKDRTQAHHIKNRIRAIKSIANVDIFIPEHYKSGDKSYYRIAATEKDIIFRENTTL